MIEASLVCLAAAGRSVLAFAVESGNVALVQELMEWGQQVAYPWPIDQSWEFLEEAQPAMVEVLSGMCTQG